MPKGNMVRKQQIICGLIISSMLLAYCPNIVSASPITDRKVVIGSSIASADTTYDFTFTAPTATTIKSVKFQACDTAGGDCTQTGSASGFSSSTPGSALVSTTGLGGAGSWMVDNSDSHSLRITNTDNSGSPSVGALVKFSNVHNPSATNSTFFIRITTYSDANWTTAIDNGTVATSTAGRVTVSVAIDEQLAFTLSDTTVTLDTPTVTTAGTGTSSMTLSTNAATGYTVSYVGTTLTSGTNAITAMSSATTSVPNSKQFGLNLVANTLPSVGSNKSGSGSGIPSVGYDTANNFKFLSGDTIASASIPTNTNTFTTSYIVNMDGSTAAGVYSTVLTYVATANF